MLQANFEVDSNPDGQDLERIAQITGLSKRVTQVWFQNSRARQKKHKEKKIDSIGGIDLSETSNDDIWNGSNDMVKKRQTLVNSYQINFNDNSISNSIENKTNNGKNGKNGKGLRLKNLNYHMGKLLIFRIKSNLLVLKSILYF